MQKIHSNGFDALLELLMMIFKTDLHIYGDNASHIWLKQSRLLWKAFV